MRTVNVQYDVKVKFEENYHHKLFKRINEVMFVHFHKYILSIEIKFSDKLFTEKNIINKI